MKAVAASAAKRSQSGGMIHGTMLTLMLIAAPMPLLAQAYQQASYPQAAVLVPLSEKANLQAKLDKHKVVRLEAGDYRAKGPASITIGSDQGVYGHPSITMVPPINLQPGASRAVIQAVNTPSITFQPGAPSTQNLFKRIYKARVVSIGAAVENNLFLDLPDCFFAVDNSAGGYFRNNRIIKHIVHSWGHGVGKVGVYPVSLKGAAALTSGNNVFLMSIFLTPQGDAVYIDNQSDLTYVCGSAEAWCWNGKPDGLMDIGPMGTFRMYNWQGGTNQRKYGLLDVAATTFIDLEDTLHVNNKTDTTCDLTLRRTNQDSLVGMRRNKWSVLDENTGGTRIHAFNLASQTFTANGTNYTTTLPSAVCDSMRRMVMSPRAGGAYWEGPVYEAIPDPAGPNWNSNLAAKPDSRASLQGYIDDNEVVPAGIYYIDAPLVLTNGQTLLGSGAGQTVIIAKTAAIDLVTGGDQINSANGYTGGKTMRYNLGDITLQGGKNGLHTDDLGSGGWADPNLANISCVTFRNMAVAGIHVERIYAWDNNFIDNCNFVDCAAAGFKQTPDPAYAGGNKEKMCFIDKVVFYGCQFVHCGIGADLAAKRQDNQNAFIECLFQSNTVSAANLVNNSATSFVNCDFQANSGNPAITQTAQDFQGGQFIGCWFQAPATGTSSLFANFTGAEGCLFDNNGNPSAVILSVLASKNCFYNCRSYNMAVGTVKSGVYFNNFFPADPTLNREAVLANDGTLCTLMSNPTGSSSPKPQLLYGDIQPQLKSRTAREVRRRPATEVR